MKTRFVEQGAGRYVAGNVTSFYQTNEMFCRPFFLWMDDLCGYGKQRHPDRFWLK
jgi:hypothetical protein